MPNKSEIQEVIVLNIAWKRVEFSIDLLDPNGDLRLGDKGLYQIYGRHNAYGEDALLYIGKTHDSFVARLSGRWEFIESSAQPKWIRFGRFLQPKNDPLDWTAEKWDAMIVIAEKLLIRAHSPAMNKQGTTGLILDDELKDADGNLQHYVILNWEDYGSLLPEVSTLRNSYRFWGFDTPMGWATQNE